MRSICAFMLSVASFGLLAEPAEAQDWPEVYEPLQLLNLNLEMDPDDWETVKADLTFDIEVQANFWADGEGPILVSVRRKSATALGPKVSLKIDINEYVDQKWHGLKKLSMENGDDVDVVSEGLAWYLHRIAAEASAGAYDPGFAAWTTLYVNGEYLGVYLNVEQRDKTFLKNRGLWSKGETWLYKTSDVSSVELKEGDPNSPTHDLLCYEPFWVGSRRGSCHTPDDDTLEADLSTLIDMDVMLTLGAIEAFSSGPDGLFSKGKNFYYLDFLGGRQRLYIPWDLDSVLVKVDESIYGTLKGGRNPRLVQSPYQELILNHPVFRAQYNQIMSDLLAGPFQGANLVAFIDALEVLLAPALEADLNNNIVVDDSISEHFDWLRSWVLDRIVNVQSQLAAE